MPDWIEFLIVGALFALLGMVVRLYFRRMSKVRLYKPREPKEPNIFLALLGLASIPFIGLYIVWLQVWRLVAIGVVALGGIYALVKFVKWAWTS